MKVGSINSNLGSTLTLSVITRCSSVLLQQSTAYARQLKSKWTLMLPYYGIGVYVDAQ